MGLIAMLVVSLAASAVAIVHLVYHRQEEQRASAERLVARTKLLRAAAHELRQPLNGITGLVASLRSAEHMKAGTRRELTTKLEETARKLNETLIDTLEVFELSAGEITLEQEPVDLRAEVQLLIRKLNRALADHGSSVKVLGGSLPEVWLELDPLRLRQCLANLIHQAALQSRDGPVRLSYQVETGKGEARHVTFHIRDSGTGMDQHRARRFFDAAEYEQNPCLRGRPSAMLALNLTAGLAELMGGRAWAESALGQGTSFYLKIRAETCPPLEGDQGQEQPIQPEAVNPSFDKLSVLLVDDNDVNLFVLQEFVMPLGFGRVVCAHGGVEAVERAEKEAFDLVLLDLAMPDVDGFQAASLIKEGVTSANAPILAVSAEHMRGDDPRLAAAGIEGFVAKPVLNADLFAEILKVTPHMLEAARSRGVAIDGDEPPLRAAS